MRPGGAGRATTLVSGATEGCTTRSTAAKIRSSTAEPYTSGMADLRSLPSVDRMLQEPAAQELAARAGRDVAVAGRAPGAGGAPPRRASPATTATRSRRPSRSEALDREAPHLRPVVERHRRDRPHQPRARAAGAARRWPRSTAVAGGYANLELDLETGGRGSRQDAVAPLLASLTGAEAGARGLQQRRRAGARAGRARRRPRGGRLARPAGRDRRRLPHPRHPRRQRRAPGRGRRHEPHLGRRLRARDHARDGADAARAPLQLPHRRLHRGGRHRDAGRDRRASTALPVLDDLGSGLLAPDPVFAGEPDARGAIAAGATLVCFSGDKLLGGPQSRDHRRHPRRRRARPPPPAGPRRAHRQARRSPRWRRRCGCTATRRGRGRAIPVLRMAHEPAGERARARRAAGRGHRRRGRRHRGPRRRRLDAGAGRCRPAPRRCPIRAARCRRRCGPGCRRWSAASTTGRLLLDARTLTDDDVAVVAAAVLRRPRMTLHTLGTAGHVDHGKTALVGR